MKSLFLVSAVAQDLSNIKHPLSDFSKEEFFGVLKDTLEHMNVGDCKKLKAFLKPKFATGVKKVLDFVNEAGRIGSQTNPMIGTVVSMAQGAVSSTLKNAGDDFLNNKACDFFINNIPAELKGPLLAQTQEIVELMADESNCDELKKKLKQHTKNINAPVSEVVDRIGEAIVELDTKYPKEKLDKFIKTGKEMFIHLILINIDVTIEEHVCQVLHDTYEEESGSGDEKDRDEL